ncbi:hypothetical protein IT408_00240 [Candidatus Uhrbacteria bacterium]|nr:hypothetical protein [Candidatus Uhrbacteria bacterium]
MYLIATSAGIIAGVIILFLAHIAPHFGAGNFVRDLDQPRILGKEVTRRESHLIGIFVHLLISGVFGCWYAILVQSGIFLSFDFLPILIWSTVLFVFMGGVIIPLEGHGLFGIKEDVWFPFDLLMSNIFWGILFWFTMRLWIVAN